MRLPRDEKELLPLVGRRRELRFLESLLSRGSRALVTGPRGIGKTRLIGEAAAACGLQPVRLQGPRTLHELLELLLPRITDAPCPPAGLRSLPSQALQARALAALGARPRWLWIDDPHPADPRLYRFLQRVLWIDGCGLAVSACGREQLGHLERLLWDPREQLALQPLGRAASEALLEHAIRAFAPGAIGPLENFRRQALAAAAGNPGRLVTLCRLAAQPQYWHGAHLLFTPLWMDMLTMLA